LKGFLFLQDDDSSNGRKGKLNPLPTDDVTGGREKKRQKFGGFFSASSSADALFSMTFVSTFLSLICCRFLSSFSSL